jgi:hypothetical protein
MIAVLTVNFLIDKSKIKKAFTLTSTEVMKPKKEVTEQEKTCSFVT